MGNFWMADLKANGDLHLKELYDYALLLSLPGCADMIGFLSGKLWQSPSGFDSSILPLASALTIRWCATAPTAGLLTVRGQDGVVSFSVMASGLSSDADSLTINALQQQLLQALHGTVHEPAFSLIELTERPLAVTINLARPANPEAVRTAALADRCFAAAYFRYLELA